MSNFKRRRLPVEILLLCVRWSCKYGISYRDLAEMMQERGIKVELSTIFRSVQRYAPEIGKRVRCYRGAHSGSWRVDETNSDPSSRDQDTNAVFPTGLQMIMSGNVNTLERFVGADAVWLLSNRGGRDPSLRWERLSAMFNHQSQGDHHNPKHKPEATIQSDEILALHAKPPQVPGRRKRHPGARVSGCLKFRSDASSYNSRHPRKAEISWSIHGRKSGTEVRRRS